MIRFLNKNNGQHIMSGKNSIVRERLSYLDKITYSLYAVVSLKTIYIEDIHMKNHLWFLVIPPKNTKRIVLSSQYRFAPNYMVFMD